MNYKYKKGQLFAKKLDLPKNILLKVYKCQLSLNDFFKYNLDDKIPTSCIVKEDRIIIDKFGIEKCKELDWELFNIIGYGLNAKELLKTIDENTEDLNKALYEQIKDKIRPSSYTKKMKEVYSDRLLPVSEEENSLNSIALSFNSGYLRLEEIIDYWELLKNKDLNYCLKNDEYNEPYNITSDELKDFMNNYGDILFLVKVNINTYKFIRELTDATDKKEYIKNFTDTLLGLKEDWDIRYKLLDNYDYKEIFKYSSLEEYLKTKNSYIAPLIKELATLPEDYIFETHIPFETLSKYKVLNLICRFGLKNIIDFDNECGHFFSNDGYKMLLTMDDEYLSYAGNEHDIKKNIYYDEDGNYISDNYTKEQFYLALRKLLLYRFFYEEKPRPDYRTITGEFREKNPDLFLSDDAPEELKKLFYSKLLKPAIFKSHPDYLEYLKDKNPLCYFFRKEITINNNDENHYENIYDYFIKKFGFDKGMSFLADYSDIIDICTDFVEFEEKDDLETTKKKFLKEIRKQIFEQGIEYPKIIPDEMKQEYPDMFLAEDTPEELKEAFYTKKITKELLESNKTYINYLKKVDIELLFKPIMIEKSNSFNKISLLKMLKEVIGEDDVETIIKYETYIEEIIKNDNMFSLKYNSVLPKKETLKEIDIIILEKINKGKFSYSKDMPEHFKKNNHELFLPDSVSETIQTKFYNKELTYEDFKNNPELIELFDKTNIAYGLGKEFYWLIPLFDNNSIKEANINRLKILEEYYKYDDALIKQAFKEYVISMGNEINIERIKYIHEVLSKLSQSNSNEIARYRKELATQIIKSENPLETASKIEDLFVKNNIPMVGKVYSCFEILHPDFKYLNISSDKTSPVLYDASLTSKKIIVFSDLIKTSFGSNNRSVNSFLKNIELGSILFEKIKTNEINNETLNEETKKELKTFYSHLKTLYDNTLKGKNNSFISTGDVIKDIIELAQLLSPNGTLDYNIGDRIIRMFCGFTGINTLKEAKDYISKKIKDAEQRNISASTSKMELEKGDLIKGIKPNLLPGEDEIEACLRVLPKILQNGSVSKEFLGANASSDSTPMDTDLSMIQTGKSMEEKIRNTQARSYGPIWFILKNDDRFITTRTEEKRLETKKDLSKLELFYTGALGNGHYGIRTGFASTDINYIMVKKYDARIGLEIAINGFYIPVVDTEGNILFTYKMFKDIRAKMKGLSYYGTEKYELSSNLKSPEIEETKERLIKDIGRTNTYLDEINNSIFEALKYSGIPNVVKGFYGDLTKGIAEVYSTGSTSRNTNVPNDSDFDYLIKIDRDIYYDNNKLEIFKTKMKEKLRFKDGFGGKICGEVTKDNGETLDVEISFCPRTDKVELSTDTSLSAKLQAIKEQFPESYIDVLANIVYAKELFKSVQAYKSLKSDSSQGGLGGIGIENWILQHGGSLYDAAKDFLEKAEEAESFEKFKEIYQVFDLGDNHYSDKTGTYPHDNFVGGKDKMGKAGYERMITVLKEYIKKIEENLDYNSKKR